MISDGVVAKVAGLAAREIPGVYDLGRGLGRPFGALLVAAEVASALLGKGELIVPTRSWVSSLRGTAYHARGAQLGFGSAVALGRTVIQGTGAVRARARVRARRSKVMVRLIAEGPPAARDAVDQRAGEQLRRLLCSEGFEVALHLKHTRRVI